MCTFAHYLHTAHHPGIEERAHEEGGQAGCGNSGCQTKDETEGFISLPEGWGRNDSGNATQRHDEEVHQETHPDDETGLAESPHLGDAVVEDVRDREDDESAGERDVAIDAEYFGLQEIGGDEAYAEEDAHQHEEDAYRPLPVTTKGGSRCLFH